MSDRMEAVASHIKRWFGVPHGTTFRVQPWTLDHGLMLRHHPADYCFLTQWSGEDVTVPLFPFHHFHVRAPCQPHVATTGFQGLGEYLLTPRAWREPEGDRLVHPGAAKHTQRAPAPGG